MQYENKEFNKLLTSVLLIEPYEKRFIPTNDKVQFENLRRNLEIKNEEQKKAEQITKRSL